MKMHIKYEVEEHPPKRTQPDGRQKANDILFDIFKHYISKRT